MLELLIVSFIAIIFLTILGTGISRQGFINPSSGTGEKAGQIVFLNHRGFIRNTWEAQLIRGGMTDGSGAFGVQPFDFTIEDERLKERVQLYVRDNTEVLIKYRIEGICSPFRSESKCTFLTDVEPIRHKSMAKPRQ